MDLTRNEKALIITLLFRFLFGGYIGGMDQYLFKDTGSAQTVILIYVVTGILFSLYLFGRRMGLKTLIGLEFIMLILNVLYTVSSIIGMFDPGLHDPLSDVWLTISQILFSAITLLYAILVYREKPT
jgi:hypothetical protein